MKQSHFLSSFIHYLMHVLQFSMIFFINMYRDTNVCVNRALFLSHGFSWPQRMMQNDLRLLAILTAAFLTQKTCLDWWERYIIVNSTWESLLPLNKTNIYQQSNPNVGLNSCFANRWNFSWRDRRRPMLWISSIRL